jgi:hypothetical protein
MQQEQNSLDKNAPVILRITTEGIKAEFKKSTGGKVFKNINVDSMAKILNTDAEFDTGFLPLYGKNYMGTKRYIKYPDKEIMLVEASPSWRTVKFDTGGGKIKELSGVAFPGLLMAVVCRPEKNGTLRIVHERLFATGSPTLRDTDILYRFPFGNVYEDGRICWGQVNESKNIKSISQAGSLLDTFLFNTMNSDLYYKSEPPLLAYLESLQSGVDFPHETLRATQYTIKELTLLMKSKNIG